MTCNSITEFKALSNLEQDEFLRQYWKTEDFVFYGEFVPEISEKESRSGIIQNIKPGPAVTHVHAVRFSVNKYLYKRTCVYNMCLLTDILIRN